MLIPVYDRFWLAYPRHAEGEHATYGEFVEAMSTVFAWDAHFSPYSVPAIARRLDGHRGEIFKHTTVPMVLFVVDCDAPKGVDRAAWDDEQGLRAQLAIADGAFVYETLGGFRLVWRLAEPVVLTSLHDAERWKASYLAALDEVQRRYKIVGDRACCDWTRQFRLPFVVRQRKDTGELHAHTPENTPTTDPSTMGAWSWTVVDVPEPRTLTTVDGDHAFPPASPELIEHVRGRLRRHGPAVEGKGGDNHTYVACAMVTHGYALSDAEAVGVLTEWNRTCVPPWDGDDLRTKMDNAFTYGEGDIGDERRDWESDQVLLRAFKVTPPGAMPGPTPLTIARPAIDAPLANGLIDILGEMPEAPTDAAPADEYGAMLEAVAGEIAAYTGDTSSGPRKETRLFQSASILFAGDYRPPNWLINGLVLEGGIAMIGAEAKASKTWLGTEMALALATGTPVCGNQTWRPTRRTRVAYFYTEDMRDSIRSRSVALLAGRGLTAPVHETLGDWFHAEPRGRKLDVTKLDDCARIIASARMAGACVVVLDPLRNIHLRDEDKSGEMAVVFENLKMIGTLLSTPEIAATVIIVHHSKKHTQNASKRGGQMLRGSSAIHGFIDSAVYLSDTRTSDDASTITNAVQSETKSGKAAGSFELSIKIVDDPISLTAVRATWEIGSKGETAQSEDDVDSLRSKALEIVGAFYENLIAHRSTGMTTEAIDAKVRGKAATKTLAKRVAVQERWLRQDRKTQTFHITPAGEAIAREVHAATHGAPVINVPPSESGHPAANFMPD